MAKKHAWYICPICRSRVAVAHDHVDEIRCHNCSTLLRPAKHTTASPTNQRSSVRGPRDDDEYHLAPLGDRQTTSSPGHPVESVSPGSTPELERLRARRERLAEPGSPESAYTAPGASATLPIGDLEAHDDERYKPAPPPRWTFFSGVFSYPWRPQSILPWVVLSIGTALCEGAGLMILSGLASGSREGALIAGFFGLCWIWLVILTGSYAAACVFAVTETTAYNYDDPYDWPEPDWRERFVHLLWLGWCLGLAAAVLVLPLSLITDSLQARSLLIAVGVTLLFPIFVLSTLETNSLMPLSGPVLRSLASDAATWIVFYIVTGLLLAGSALASAQLYLRLGMLSPLVLGPLWASIILLYARLLGRLAWRIMRPGELQLQAWRKARQSTLAGEQRKRQLEEEATLGE